MIKSYLNFGAEIYKNRKKGVIVDTNLLLLLLIGLYDPAYISQFKRTHEFTRDDFEILRGFLSKFERVLLTPHVLAEVSNFCFEIPENRLKFLIEKTIATLRNLGETNVSKELILESEGYPKFGVTDASILLSAKSEGSLIFTKDRALAGYGEKIGLRTLHFDYLRSKAWFENR